MLLLASRPSNNCFLDDPRCKGVKIAYFRLPISEWAAAETKALACPTVINPRATSCAATCDTVEPYWSRIFHGPDDGSRNSYAPISTVP